MIYGISMICADPSFQKLCKKPYYNHPRGCPNYGGKKGCPPKQKMYDKVFSGDYYLIFTSFDLGRHIKKMKKKHPNWTDRQVACCLYWQGTARKKLKAEIMKFKKMFPGHIITTCPEAMGVNITMLMLHNADIDLEWPPQTIAYQVAMAGKPQTRKRGRQ